MKLFAKKKLIVIAIIIQKTIVDSKFLISILLFKMIVIAYRPTPLLLTDYDFSIIWFQDISEN